VNWLAAWAIMTLAAKPKMARLQSQQNAIIRRHNCIARLDLTDLRQNCWSANHRAN
jgi:hypothetical protein